MRVDAVNSANPISIQFYEGLTRSNYLGKQSSSRENKEELRELKKIEILSELNQQAQKINNITNSLTTLNEFIDATLGTLKLLKKQQTKPYQEALSREIVDLTRESFKLAEALASDIENSSLLKPSDAKAFKETLEKLITVPSMKNLPDNIEKVWDSVVEFRAQMIKIAELIESKKRELQNQLSSLSSEKNIEIKATTEELILIHSIKPKAILT